MHYTELPWPFEGWTVDEHGWIHSPSGYRTNPQLIEGYCWLFGMWDYTKSIGGDRLMFADSPPPKPVAVWNWKDFDWPRKNDIKVSLQNYRLRRSRLAPRAVPTQKTTSRSRR